MNSEEALRLFRFYVIIQLKVGDGMKNILFEATFEFEFAYLIPIFMLIFISLFPLIMKKYYENNDVRINYKVVRIFCGCAFAFVALISVIVGVFQVNMFSKTVGAYNKGDYEIVEGYVENFIPMPYEGHSDESFEINGVKFSYSDYSIQPGYNNSKSHGGVVFGNGQHLKIGYVYYNEVYGNIIVYIEQLS